MQWLLKSIYQGFIGQRSSCAGAKRHTFKTGELRAFNFCNKNVPLSLINFNSICSLNSNTQYYNEKTRDVYINPWSHRVTTSDQNTIMHVTRPFASPLRTNTGSYSNRRKIIIFYFNLCIHIINNKKLSCRRDRATLRVIKHFAKSLKIIRNDTVEWGVCKSLLVFHWNYVCRT